MRIICLIKQKKKKKGQNFRLVVRSYLEKYIIILDTSKYDVEYLEKFIKIYISYIYIFRILIYIFFQRSIFQR